MAPASLARHQLHAHLRPHSLATLPRSSSSAFVRPSSSRSRPSPVSHTRSEPRFNYLPGTASSPFDPSPPDPELSSHRLVTAADLVRLREPPKRVRLLARDFIDDSLYNPNYGYFSTRVEIFDPDRAAGSGPRGQGKGKKAAAVDDEARSAEGFNFPSFPSTAAFEEEVARRYMVFEGRGSGHEEEAERTGRQVWHTPTELFKPWYGRALARYLASSYLSPSLSSSASPSTPSHGPSYPYDDLIIYEIGAGNGTLMGDILDYLAAHEPEVYARTKYRIIEISPRLKGMQEQRARGGRPRASGKPGAASAGGDDPHKELEEVKRRGHQGKVEVIGKSIFEWDRVVEEPCFFIAMEVLDNLSHDVIRYTTDTHTPLQCTVAVDSSGDYTELFSPVSDPLLRRYLSLRSRLPSFSSRPSPALNPILHRFPALRQAWTALPFAPNLSQPEFIPTRQLQLLEILRDKFPRHRVVMSDFDELPDAVHGVNGPVVQTRYQGETVPCTTYLVQPGFFDIFFPTDFRTMAELYALVMSRPSPSPSSAPDSAALPSSANRPSPSLAPDFFSPRSGKNSSQKRELEVVDHAAFLEKWAEVEQTRTGDGTNPLLDSYANAKFVLS
ncbi:hypothetical protein JCM10207_008078 [Rhodosporidiobolus poonsookiae]